MLKPDYFNGKSNKMLELYRQLEDWIMQDIANRLLTAGEMSGTADRLIWKLQQMGESRRMIENKLSQLTKLTRYELRKLLQDAVLTSWEYDKESMEQWMGNNSVKSPLKNPEVIRVMDAEYKKSLGALDNLTRTTLDQSQQDLINMFDEAEVRTASGVQSYSAAVCDILDEYAKKGLLFSLDEKGQVTYRSGHKMTLESVVNMVVRTSMNQTAAQVTNQYIVESKTNHVLVSAHYGARVRGKGQPYLAGHDLWQGKAYCIVGSEPGYPNLKEDTGYDINPETGEGIVTDVRGLHGINCRHSHQPWDKSLRNPWVDENGNPIINTEESRKMYENQQKARAMERVIRKTKRQLLMKETEINQVADQDMKERLKQDYDRLAYRLRQENRKYNTFCKQNDVQKQYERTKVSGFKKEDAAKANGAATRYQNRKK